MSNMGRSPCRSKEGLDREAWTAMEDMILTEYIRIHGDGAWANLPEKAGLKRCGKSCRLHCLNYLRPAIKSGNISLDEEDLIIRMHRLLGNRWSLIAGRLPGRTDNEIKNYWNTRLSKKLLLMNESQTSLRTQSLKTSSDSPPLQRNRVFKTPPLKTTTVVTQAEMAKPNGCNSDACTKSITDEDLSLCNVKETMNCPKSQCDLPRNDFIIDNDSVNILFSNADVNFIETETRSSTCSLPEKQSSNSDHFAGDEATLADNSLYLKELSSPQWNLLLSPSYFSTDFGLEDFYREPITTAAEKNDYEDIIFYPSNMQPIDSFRVADCQEMEEFHVNWNVNSITFRTDKEELEETDRTKLGVSRPWTLTR